MSDAATLLEETRRALAAGPPLAAWRCLRPLLDHPAAPLVDSPEAWSPGLALFEEISAALGAESLTARVRDARAKDDGPTLLSLGWELIEAGLPELAATTLARAAARDPQHPGILAERCAALERAGAPAEVVALLQARPTLTAAHAPYAAMLGWNALMAGDLELAALVADEPRPEAEPEVQETLSQLRRALLRAIDLPPAGPLDLRGWHSVITGGLLLERAPEGEDLMNGRYAWVQDTERSLRASIQRLRAALEAWSCRPPRVWLLPDRSSEILGRAVALLLGVPALPWRPEGGGLVVAWDLDDLDPEQLLALSSRLPGQLFYAHTADWLKNHPVAPDLLGRLHQYEAAPWEARQSPTGEVPVDDAPAAVIGRRIAALPSPPPSPTEADLRAMRLHARAMGPPPYEGRREALWAGGPVPSPRFW